MSRTPGAKDKQKRKPRSDGNTPFYNNSPVYQGQTAEIPQEYNARKIAFMQDIIPTEPLNHNDVAEMERRFNRYISKCQEWGMKIGNQGAYIAIGITKSLAWQWTNEVKSNPERCAFIKKVQQICGYYREGLMEDGKVNPAVGIFWQKNYDGLKDEQEVVLTPNNPLGEQKDAESLKQKYLEASYNTAELPEGTESPEGVVLSLPESDPVKVPDK